MPQQTLAVIIPTYNSQTTLIRALESVAAQTRPPEELIVADGASTSPEMANLLADLQASPTYKGIPLKVLRSSVNNGVGAARNQGIMATQAEIIAFLDADDWWAPTHLARSVEDLVRKGATFVASNYYEVAANGKQTLQNSAAIAARKEFFNGGHTVWGPRTHYFYRAFIGALTVVIWRSALVRAGGFSTTHRHALDWECWHAVLAATPNGFFYISPEATAYYTLSSTGLTSRTMERLVEREDYLPNYAKSVAAIGGVWWPLLLARAWVKIQAETLAALSKRRAWSRMAQVVARMPGALAWALWHTLMVPPFGHGQRPNYLLPLQTTWAEGRGR